MAAGRLAAPPHGFQRVGTSITEGTAKFLVNRRMNQERRMRWSRRGADFLLQESIPCVHLTAPHPAPRAATRRWAGAVAAWWRERWRDRPDTAVASDGWRDGYGRRRRPPPGVAALARRRDAAGSPARSGRCDA